MWLTLAAMRNGIAILMASLAIILLGATSLGRMPIDLFPNINYPSLQIGTVDVGSEANAPLAGAVIGGLAVSTMLTPILIPTLYVILEERFPRRVEVPHAELALQGDRA